MARPVGLYNTPFGATSGGRGVKRGVSNESEDRVFVRGVHTLVFKNFRCGNSVGVAGSCLCGFHYLKRAIIARRSPRFPMGTPGRFRP